MKSPKKKNLPRVFKIKKNEAFIMIKLTKDKKGNRPWLRSKFEVKSSKLTDTEYFDLAHILQQIMILKMTK